MLLSGQLATRAFRGGCLLASHTSAIDTPLTETDFFTKPRTPVRRQGPSPVISKRLVSLILISFFSFVTVAFGRPSFALIFLFGGGD